MGQELVDIMDNLRGSFSKTKKELVDNVDLKKYPLTSEPSLVHPETSSVIKVRSSGVIDIFVGNDNGVRIDPEQRSVNLFSNIYREKNEYHWSDSKKNRTINVGNDSVHNIGNDAIHNVTGKWTIHSQQAINLISDKTVYMEARESITMKSPKILLDATIPPDEMEPFRPMLGTMFEEDTPYGALPPYGYQFPHGARAKEKKAIYRREEYDDLHADDYEKKPSLRGKDKVRKDNDKEWNGPMLRKRYKESSIVLKANAAINVSTHGTPGDIHITSSRHIHLNEGGHT